MLGCRADQFKRRKSGARTAESARTFVASKGLARTQSRTTRRYSPERGQLCPRVVIPACDSQTQRSALLAALRRGLLLRSKIGAAFRAGEHLVRIAAALGIEHAPQQPHRVQILRSELLRHEIDFLHADAVLARDAAAQLDALFQDLVAGGERAADLIRIAFIVKNQRMNVAVAGVKDVRNAQPVLLAAARG